MRFKDILSELPKKSLVSVEIKGTQLICEVVDGSQIVTGFSDKQAVEQAFEYALEWLK